MQATIPFPIYPDRGCDNPPPARPPEGPGVFDVPGALPDGSRMLLAYDARGVIVGRALVERGGDLTRATLDLHRASLARRA